MTFVKVKGVRTILREEVPQTPMSSTTQSIHATLPLTGFYPGDDGSGVAFLQGTDDSRARRATPKADDVSAKARPTQIHDVNRLRVTLVQN